MNKVSTFFMEIAPYFIENFDHILFTIDVSFIIRPYVGEKLKENSENFHLKKKYFVSKRACLVRATVEHELIVSYLELKNAIFLVLTLIKHSLGM